MKQIKRHEKQSDTQSNLLQLLWPFIHHNPFRVVCLILLPLLSGGLLLVAGLLQQAFFNQLELASKRDTTIVLGILVLLATNLAVRIVSFVLDYLGAMNFVALHTSLSSLLQHNLLNRVLQHSTGRATIGSVGEAINTFEEDTHLAISFFSLLGNTLSPILLGIVACVILLRVNPLITIVVMLPLAGTSVIVGKMRTHIRGTRAARREASSMVIGSIGEIFEAIQPIKIARAENSIVEHFGTLSDHRRYLEVRDSVLSSMLFALSNGLSHLGIGMVLLATALYIQQGHTFRIGDFVLFTTYLTPILEMMAIIGYTRAAYIQAAVSSERLARLQQGAPLTQLLEGKRLYLSSNKGPSLVVASEPTIKTSQDHLDTLEISDLTYRYPGTECGIKRITIRLTRGSLTVITGEIGAGKTTFLRVLQGLLPKESGEIRWNGQLVENPMAFFVPPRSAYTAQVPHLFSDTLRDNILLGIAEKYADLSQAVHMVTLDNDIMEQTQGLDTPIGARGIKLSGGQIQRTAAARMLLRDTELLIFDDLSSALDVETEKTMWRRLFTSDKQRTYLVVSHSPAILQHANQIIVLKDGYVEEVIPSPRIKPGDSSNLP